MRSANDDVLRFVASSFRSIWALELLLLLKTEGRGCGRAELVRSMRASDLVIAKALEDLEAAGLVAQVGDCAEYLPSSGQVAEMVDRAEHLYAKRPDAVRRAIVSSSFDEAVAFADAFRLRRQ